MLFCEDKNLFLTLEKPRALINPDYKTFSYMLHHITLLAALTALQSPAPASSPTEAPVNAPQSIVSRIDPPNWWAGMESDTLQLLVSGPDVGKSTLSLSYPGVEIISQNSLDNDDYKFVYLHLFKDLKPGSIPLTFSLPSGKSQTVDYPLLERLKSGNEHQGFSAADVLYLLMPDRFAFSDSEIRNPYESLEFKAMPDRLNPNARHGGNIPGITSRLDYLRDLGVTALWVCPVLENDMPGGSYHGYATTDYYRIDPRFGSNAEYSEMIRQAHAGGLKVVMDMIFNHSGSNHPWMKSAPSKDWFNHPEGDVMTNYRLTTVHDPYASEFDRDATVNGWFVSAMPDLNQRNPHLMKYLTQNSIWWIESSDIDGIRMDTYPYADARGMASWIDGVLKEYPGFNIVGECWYANEGGSAFWQRGNRLNPDDPRLPSVMDFRLVIDGDKFFNEETTPWSGLNGLYDHLSMDFLFPEPQKILTFLDNHDTDRFLRTMPENLDTWRQAVTFLLTSRGIPQIYYGTELLMNGSKEGSDGFVRCDFPGGFPDDKENAFIPQGRTELQNEAWIYLSSLLRWRRDVANDVIARGSLKHFMPINCAYVYERRLGDKQVVVLINGRDETLPLDMQRYAEILPEGSVMTESLSGQPLTIGKTLDLKPRQTLILQNF